MKLKLISCEIFFREVCTLAARSPHRMDVMFLPKGLHDIGAQPMLERVQAAVDACGGETYDAILLGYGLCNNGLVGLTARAMPLIVPRAHDCMALFFGSRRRYQEYFDQHPGTYFFTTGWLERGEDAGGLRQLSIGHQMGMDKTLGQLVAEYGEDNAKFLYETLCAPPQNYRQCTFIEMGVEPDGRTEQAARARAVERGWNFEKIPGDLRLLDRLLNGPWNDADFLTVSPGRRIVARYDDGVIALE
ncbi:MAG: DUF1638 domain-containing protein [Verrucomicrobia bacterium]|nr:MAG: DUF1638 domain-containing protein [Verrucomicrobiota bacterium]